MQTLLILPENWYSSNLLYLWYLEGGGGGNCLQEIGNSNAHGKSVDVNEIVFNVIIFLNLYVFKHALKLSFRYYITCFKNVPFSLITSIFHFFSRLGEVIRFRGKFSGILNGVNFQDLRLDVIAMSRDGRVYVVIRRPPTSLAHSLKILTPFANALGWMHGVSKVKGVPNGLSVLRTKLTRNMVVSFDSGNFALIKCISTSCFTLQTSSYSTEWQPNLVHKRNSTCHKSNSWILG